MNIYDIKNRSFTDLSQGYYAEKEYFCPVDGCDFTCHETYQMKKHLKDAHNKSVKVFRYGKKTGEKYCCPLCSFSCREQEEMDKHFRVEHPDGVESRFYFYKLTGKYICLHCDYFCNDHALIEQHEKTVHLLNEEAQFIQLLTADSVFIDVLSYAQKMTLLYAYYGMSNVEIAKKLGISANTVGTNLNRFLNKEGEYKAALRLIEMLRIENQSADTDAQPHEDMIPGLDENGIVKGYYNKDQLHSPTAPIPHASVILLVVHRFGGQFRFLVCEKSSQQLTLAAKTENMESHLPSDGAEKAQTRSVKKRWIDFLGGQVKKIDAHVELGKPLNDSNYTAALAREYNEEIRVKAVGLKSGDANAAIDLKARSMDVSKMRYLYTDKVYRSPLDPVGLNTETTQVFIHRLPDELPPNGVLVRDEWTDSVGGHAEKDYPSEFLSWQEIEQLAASKDTVLMEGARRVVERMKRDPELKKKLFDQLADMEA